MRLKDAGIPAIGVTEKHELVDLLLQPPQKKPQRQRRSRSANRKSARIDGQQREQREASYSYYSDSSSPDDEGNVAGNGMLQPWQVQVMSVLERFTTSGKDFQQLPEEFDFTSPQLMLLKQLAPAKNAVIVEKDHRFWLRRISSKVARAGPFGAIRNVLKMHGGRMTVKQCVLLIENTYDDERLMLEMCNMRTTWHERLNLKQYQGEFKKVGVVFDKRMAWMAIKGSKKPGPESESDVEGQTSSGPRHVVSVHTDEDMELQVDEALRLTRRALDEVERRRRGRSNEQEEGDEASRGVYSDGLPWWGNAPLTDVPLDQLKSDIAQVTKRRLPAYEMRDVVNDAIDQFSVVVVVGATGCGKSTQLPLAWYERCKTIRPEAPCKVVCCEPRKIAAMSLANRVSLEIGKPLGTTVGYKIRFETQASRETDVLYCTTGVLLRAMMRNPTLEGVTCVFIDEVHERDVLADFTMLVLRDVMQNTRKDLKLVLMSATVDPAWCQKYFPDCHAIDLPGDQPFTVDWHWLEDCLDITGHRPQVPIDGDVDVAYRAKVEGFMEALPARHSERSKVLRDVILAPSDWIDLDLIVKLVEHIELREDPAHLSTLEDEEGETSTARGAILIFMPGMSEIRTLIQRLKNSRAARNWSLLPLHSSLPPHDQQKVFKRPAANVRKVIVSTNIAESSVTIDDVVYVIDSGRERLLDLNAETNVSSLMTQWIARSNSNQRKGRAGRCRAGSYYTLFSSVQFSEVFVDSHLPEMQRSQVESLCLQAKALGFADVHEALGLAPDPPDKRTIESALRTLATLGAMQEDSSLTRLGRLLLRLPVHPQLGKFLLYSRLFECTDAALTIAAAMDVGRLFTMVPGGQRDAAERRRMELSGGLRSDHWSIVQAYRSWRELEEEPAEQKKLTDKLFISHKSLESVHRLREELLHSLQELQGQRRRPVDQPPSWREAELEVTDEMALVSAALASSFHLARVTPLFDLVCLNSPPCRAAMVPLSVNAKRHLLDPRLFREGLAVWFSRLQTSQLFVDDCSIVRAIHVLLLGPPLSAHSDFPRHVQLQPPRHGREDAAEASEAAEILRSRRLEREQEEQRIVSEIKELVAEIYKVHNPSKLGEVDGLFLKYEGVEREMYVRICSKYGVDPEDEYMPHSGDDEGQHEDEESQAAMRLQHIERHVPWLKCSSPHALRSLLELREASSELLGHCVGQPYGALPEASAVALQALVGILVGAGSLGDMCLKRHHEFGDLAAFPQIPAPLEEPWICEQWWGRRGRGRGRKDSKATSTGDYADSSPARRERWNRDPEGQLLHWLIQELKSLRGHSLEIGHLNKMLYDYLGDDARSEALWDLAVTRRFIDKHPRTLRLVGDSSVGLHPDYQPSEHSSSRSRSRSRSRDEGSSWHGSQSSNAWAQNFGARDWGEGGGPAAGFALGWMKGMKGMKASDGKGWAGKGYPKGGAWSSMPMWAGADGWARAQWHASHAWAASYKGSQARPAASARLHVQGSQARPSAAAGADTFEDSAPLGKKADIKSAPSVSPAVAPKRPKQPSFPPPGRAPVSSARPSAAAGPSQPRIAPTPKSQVRRTAGYE